MFRIYPRDLFNDANLLKCIGQLSLFELDGKLPEGWEISIPEPYEIEQNEGNGATFIVGLTISKEGREVHFERPMNSREPWPLYGFELEDQEEIEVFNDKGELSKEFINFLEELK